MNLTLDEAAARLGKSPRQVRYMINAGRLEAAKFGGRWMIDSDHLDLSEAQQQAVERKERRLRAAVEEGLGLPEKGKRRYSVRDLKAVQIALPLHRQAAEVLGADHPATGALRLALEHLARGCHRFDRSEKAAAYRDARDAASAAVCELLLSEGETAETLVTAIEQELMAALAGLLRRLDRRRPR